MTTSAVRVQAVSFAQRCSPLTGAGGPSAQQASRPAPASELVATRPVRSSVPSTC